MRTKKKLFAVIAALAMLAGMLSCGAVPVLAGGGAVTVVTSPVPTLPGGGGSGNLAEIAVSGLPAGDQVTLTLPQGVAWAGTAPAGPSYGYQLSTPYQFTLVDAQVTNPDGTSNGFALPSSSASVAADVYFSGVANAVYETAANGAIGGSGGGITATEPSATQLAIKSQNLNSTGNPGSVYVVPYVSYTGSVTGPVNLAVSDTAGAVPAGTGVTVANIGGGAAGTAAITVSPGTASPGQTITVNGTGFPANAQLASVILGPTDGTGVSVDQVLVGGTPTADNAVFSDSSGNISFGIALPGNLGPKDNVVTIWAGNPQVQAQAMFTLATMGMPLAVMGTDPMPGSVGVPTNLAKIYVKFNQGDVSLASLQQPGNVTLASTSSPPVTIPLDPGAFTQLSMDNSVFALPLPKPSQLQPNTGYQLTVKGAVYNQDNTSLGSDYNVKFQTGGGPVTSCSITGSTIDSLASVPPDVHDITLGASTGLDPATVSPASVYIKENGVLLNPNANYFVQYDLPAQAIHIVPRCNLQPSTEYAVYVSNSVQDMAGNSLAPYVKAFVTGSTNAASPTPAIKKSQVIVSPGFVQIPFNETMTTVAGAVYLNGTVALTVNGQSIPVTNQQMQYDPMSNTLVLNITTPVMLGDPYSLTVTGTDRYGNSLNETVTGTVTMAPKAGSSGAQVVPQVPFVNATGPYTVYVPVSQAVPAGGKIVIAFPSGFDVSGADFVRDQNGNRFGPGQGPYADIDGPPGATVSAISGDSNGTVTVTLGSATAGPDMLVFPVAGIKNSSVAEGPSTQGYTVQIATEDASGNTIAPAAASAPFFINPLPQGNATISGTVVDQNNNPVAGVPLTLGSAMGLPPQTATTGTGGAFSFTNLASGGYYIQMPSLFTAGSVEYSAPPAPVPVGIDPAGDNLTGLTLHVTNLKAAGAVSVPVKITIDGTAPSVGTSFDLFANTGSAFLVKHITQTGTTATYDLSLSPGSWNVGVGPQLVNGVPQDVTWMGQPNITVQVAAGGTVQYVANNGTVYDAASSPIGFTLSYPSSMIEGTVTDADGNPLADATVNAYNPQADVGNQTTTGGDGTYQLPVGAGTYTVEASYPGTVQGSPQSVVVSGTGTVTGVDFQLSKGSWAISGTVTDGTNVIPNAPVWAYNQSGPGFANGMTGSGGEYTLYVPAAGTWVVQAFAPGYGNLSPQNVTLSSSDPTAAAVNFEPLVSFGTVSGTVTVDGTPVQGAQIGVSDTAGDGNAAQTDAVGDYSLKLAPGTYTFNVWVPKVGRVVPDDGNATFTIDSGGSVAENFTLTTGTINVYIKDAAGNDLSAAEVPGHAFVSVVNQSTGAGNSTNLVNAASASLNVPADGTYQVTLGIPGLPQITPQSVTLSPSNPTEAVTFKIQSHNTVSGTVEVNGNPIGNAWVWARDPASGASAGGFTDANGSFSLNLPAGQYRMGVDKPGWGNYIYPDTVDLTGGDQSGISLTLVDLSGTSETVTGQVYGGGAPVNGAQVWAVDGQGGWAGYTTGATGAYTLHLPAGTWTIHYAADGYAAAQSSVTSAGSGSKDLGQTSLTATGKSQNTATTAIAPDAGGTFAANGVDVVVPADALGTGSNNGQLSVGATTAVADSNSAMPLQGNAVQISFTDSDGTPVTTLKSYITIEVPYTPDPNNSGDVLVNGTDYPVSQLVLAYWDATAQEWVAIPFVLDTADQVLKGTVDHLTTFAPIIPSGANAPATPTGVTAAASGSSAIQLAWNAVTGATGYNIYRAASADGNYAKVDSSTTDSYTDAGLTADTAYYYEVTAYNGTDESAASSPVTATTGAAGNSTGPGGGGGGAALKVTLTSLGAATAGQPYSQTITASGGTAPYTFTVTAGSLPDGLTLAASTGVLSGTPTTAGTYSFTVTVKDAAGGSAQEAYTLTVNAAAVTPPTPPAAPKIHLTDIAGSWAKAAIDKLVALGAITGYPDGTFRPDNDITRAEFATALVKALGLKPKAGPVFVDTQGSWAQGYIATAAAGGIVTGYDATHFGPNDLITREQMTVMVVRAAKLTPVAGQLAFKDAAQIDPWARADVVTAVKDGIIHGYPDGTFRPLNHANRAEAATVIAGILK